MGVEWLTAMDRHVIANMRAELGTTTKAFSSDEATRAFLRAEGREADWWPLTAGPGAECDNHDHLELDSIEPLIATPSSPGNVSPMRAVPRMGRLERGHAIVGGANYGQGASREHAAMAPRIQGLRVVVARNFARIH